MFDRIPLTLVTGYLGAGKTTLVNALLRDPSAGRIAVIVNEFGDMELDHDLIVEATEETVLLASGCLCCTVRGDLVRALEDLLARRASGGLAFERIVIETTGLADPVPILHTLIAAPGLASAIRLDGVVAVCDAVNGAVTLDRGFESVSQVAMADVIVVSKADLAPPAQLRALEARLAALAPRARRIVAERGRLSVRDLFGSGAPEENGEIAQALDWIGAPDPLPPLAPPGRGLLAAPRRMRFEPASARHDDRIVSVSAVYEAPIDPILLDLWAETLIATRGDRILRLKALIWATGFETPFVLHGVQHLLDPLVRLKRWTGGDRRSRVVLIARDVPHEALRDSLDLLRLRPGG